MGFPREGTSHYFRSLNSSICSSQQLASHAQSCSAASPKTSVIRLSPVLLLPRSPARTSTPQLCEKISIKLPDILVQDVRPSAVLVLEPVSELPSVPSWLPTLGILVLETTSSHTPSSDS